jgi:crotonobetainyl-CoA:carnitine CoA-transferase CaiB-like acyl-CoA transferase
LAESTSSPKDSAEQLAATLWHDLGGDPSLLDRLSIVGPVGVLPSIYDVTGFAAASVAVAAMAVAELSAIRREDATSVPTVTVDRLHASASFRFETLLQPIGWNNRPIWDPLAGDYEAADGWIRLHTNYEHHLRAALSVLDVPADRAAAEDAVSHWSAIELEDAVVAAGGCAAAMRLPTDWEAHPAGRATRDERPITIDAPIHPNNVGVGLRPLQAGSPPLAGIRILDLTRVIAGPVATRYLAGYGAEVLRIDPIGFREVPALLPEVTAGKRCAALDLTTESDRERFARLVEQAHVIVSGLRPDALDSLGFGPHALRSINPSLITVMHDAYGWAGPWKSRRGFDSLVQMSTGIAAEGGRAAGSDRPKPLPAQALDHGIGHLLAAGTCRALASLFREGSTSDVRGSLVGVANLIKNHPASAAATSAVTVADFALEPGETAWGPVRRVPLAGRIAGYPSQWIEAAGPLGRHAPAFRLDD